MEKADLIDYEGTHVKLLLKNSYFYTGILKKVNESTSIFIDRNGKKITIENSFVSFIESMEK